MPFVIIRTLSVLSLLVVLISDSLASGSGEPDAGKPFSWASGDTTGVRVSHISPVNTPVNNQIWSIQESILGWVFFAEEEGILALRGQDWQLIETPNASTVRSLAIDRDQKGEVLYFGEQEDFGYVKVDSTGFGEALSLRGMVPDSIQFGNVWNVHIINERVVFQTRNYLFVKEGSSIESIYSSKGFHNAFVVHNQYLVREFGAGLQYLNGSVLTAVDNADVLKDDMIAGITPGPGGKATIWTQRNGILQYDSQNHRITNSIPYSEELESIASQYRLYNTTRLDSERTIIATLGGGLLVADERTHILKRLTRGTGFPDDSQNYLHRSLFGGLWVGLDNEGVAYLDSDLVRVSYTSVNGLTGYINDIDVIDGHLVVSTGTGIHANRPDLTMFSSENYSFSTSSQNPEFVRVNDTPIVWNIEHYRGFTYLASESGVKRFDSSTSGSQTNLCSGLELEQGGLNKQAFTFYRDKESDILYVGLSDGLGIVTQNVNDCEVEVVDFGVEDVEVRSITRHGELLWLGTAFHGFIAIDIAPHSVSPKSVVISSDHPPGRNDVLNWSGRLFGYNSSGLYDLGLSNGAIDISPVNGPAKELENISVVNWQGGSRGWLVSRDQVFELELIHGQLEIASSPLALNFEKSSTSSVFVDSSGVVWFNNGSELIRYDPKYDVPGKTSFKAHVAGVKQASNGEALFNGFYRAENGGIAAKQPDWAVPVLDFDSRNLTFQFSATEFINPDGVEYRYRIDGKDEGTWTEWSDEREAMTPSIEEGAFTIVVQAKDEIGRLSETASYSFVILPPWYRTIWAYIAYLILGGSALISGRKYILMRRAHKHAAEQAKELERERQVVKRLSEANDRLTQANKLKDEFLATTSHELRTPLTAILGFTSVLKDEIPEEAEYREFLDIIEESGGRLMDTLNSLLDLAKLRAGIMEITPESVELYQYVFQEVVKLQDSAQRKGIKLKVRRPESPVYVMADVYGLGRVLHNLVGNAVKFTDEGQVEVWFEEKADQIEVHVTDTGIGIDAEFLPELFHEFIQESDGLARSHEGTGLGLAITSGIIQLMDADIRVESEKGKGSDFIVTLPKSSSPRRRPRRISGMGDRSPA